MIERVLDFNDIIDEIYVEKLIENENTYAFKSRLIFKNKSILIIRDYLFNDGSRKYSFHWMDKNEKLIVRWDNEPHWKNIHTFAHHKHIRENVHSSLFTRDKH